MRDSEELLGPANKEFSGLIGEAGRTRDQIIKDQDRVVGTGVKTIDADELAELKDDITAAAGSDASQRWMTIGRGFATGDSGTVLDGMLVHNRDVMRERNGSSPWIEIDGDELNVNFSEEASELFEKRELPTLWEHPYFITSLQSVIQQIEGAGG